MPPSHAMPSSGVKFWVGAHREVVLPGGAAGGDAAARLPAEQRRVHRGRRVQRHARVRGHQEARVARLQQRRLQQPPLRDDEVGRRPPRLTSGSELGLGLGFRITVHASVLGLGFGFSGQM